MERKEARNMALREEGGGRAEPERWTDTEHARMVGE